MSVLFIHILLFYFTFFTINYRQFDILEGSKLESKNASRLVKNASKASIYLDKSRSEISASVGKPIENSKNRVVNIVTRSFAQQTGKDKKQTKQKLWEPSRRAIESMTTCCGCIMLATTYRPRWRFKTVSGARAGESSMCYFAYVEDAISL